jgi:Delta7-sterol 5-desaturase
MILFASSAPWTKIAFPDSMEGVGAFFMGASALDFLRYFVAAAALWLFFYVLKRHRWLSRKIIRGFPAPGHVRREIALSLLTCCIYGLVVLLVWYAYERGWTRIYTGLNDYSVAWFWGSTVLTIFLHDAYFYWTHRLMHHPRLFRWMHRGHHKSVNPTPWAAYAFDPAEAVVQAGILPLVAVLYPIHPLAFTLFMAWQIGFNVFGHAGFEIFPRGFLNSWVGKFMNTPTNHAMHHEFFKGNYGLYFNLWDRWMGTNHREYEARFEQVTSVSRVPRGPH